VTSEDVTVIWLDYDATGKLGPGLVDGSLLSLGDFDQCKQLSQALYCLADISANYQLPGFNNSVCMVHAMSIIINFAF